MHGNARALRNRPIQGGRLAVVALQPPHLVVNLQCLREAAAARGPALILEPCLGCSPQGALWHWVVCLDGAMRTRRQGRPQTLAVSLREKAAAAHC